MNSLNNIKSDKIVLTLDAGGTNFIFSALQNGEELTAPIRKAANTENLDECLNILKTGFDELCDLLHQKPVAISFAFPGPADYKNGIIGDLPNFPCFRGGVAMKDFLEHHFQIPVFINNDGDLFAYGEAVHGALPYVNARLKELGSSKEYQNILGITFGTGFGAGVVLNGNLLLGDNGCGGDVWVFRNKKYPHLICEESVSIRAIKRVYAEQSGQDIANLTPEDIFNIAEGTKEGDRKAAQAAFCEFGEVAANTIAQALTIVDGLVVLGGGLTGAAKYYMPALMKELGETIGMFSGDTFPRLQMKAYDLSSDEDFKNFAHNSSVELKSPYSGKILNYEKEKKTGIIMSQLGTSRAIAIGAYAYALDNL